MQKLLKLRKKADCSGLVTTSPLNIKINEVNNIIPNISCSVKKTHSNAKISDIHTIYFSLHINNVTIKLLNLIMVIKLQRVTEEGFMMKVSNFLPYLIIDFKLN